MLDYQRVVDDFRSTLYVTGDGVAFLKAAADEYAAACEEANQRLRLCGERLRRGLRSEALQLCEIEPNLLDVVAILDFPEREQWQGAAGRYGVAPPPRLLVEVAAELNEAYAIEQPLAALLQQHRLLALARGPLKQRIGILRQLAEFDGRNPVWQEDLLLFERERIKQVHQEGHEAAGKADLSRLSGLLDELQNGPWLELPPPAIVQSMTAARERLRLQKAIADLERIGGELDAAFSALDVEAGRRLRDCWHAGLAACGSQANPWMVERAGPALAWLAAEDHKQRELAEYEAATAALEKALDDGLPPVQLEAYYQAAIRHGYSLLPQLAERYEARVSQLELASARRRRWLVVSVAATAVLVIVIVVGMIVSGMHARAVQTAASSVNRLLDEDQLWEAQGYFTNLEKTSPRVARAVGMQEAVARLEGMLKQDADREAAFAKAMGMVKLSMPDPDPAAWAEVRKLAKTDEEKRNVKKLEAVVDEHNRQVQEAADQRLYKDLEKLSERIEKLSQAKEIDLGKYESAVTRLRSEWSALETGSKNVSDAARGRLVTVGSSITTLEMEVERWRKEEARQRAITQAVGDLARYPEELKRYEGECPDFKRSVSEASLWEGIEGWNDMVRRWQKMDLRAPDSRSMAEMIATVKDLLQRHGNFPGAEALRGRIRYLEALGQRLEAGSPMQTSLKALFADPLMANVWMIETQGGRRYYLDPADQPTDPVGQISAFRHIMGFDFPFKKRRESVTLGAVTYSGPAPQAAIATEVNVILGRMNAENWEPSICSIVQAINTDKPPKALDPILKAMLLQKTLELGCQGSPSLEQAFAPHLEVLKRVNGGQRANWLDPRDVAARNVRPQVEVALAGLPDIAAAVKAACEDCAGLRACPARLHRWIGWLCRTHQGTWSCATALGLKDSGRLCVVRLATPGDKAVIEVVGRMENGTITTAPSATGAMVEGRPVYLEVAEKETKS